MSVRTLVWIGGTVVVALIAVWPSFGRRNSSYRHGDSVSIPGVGRGECDAGCLVISYIPSHGKRIGREFHHLLSLLPASDRPKVVVLTDDPASARATLETQGIRLDQVSLIVSQLRRRLISPAVLLFDHTGIAVAVWEGVNTVTDEQRLVRISTKPAEWARGKIEPLLK